RLCHLEPAAGDGDVGQVHGHLEVPAHQHREPVRYESTHARAGDGCQNAGGHGQRAAGGPSGDVEPGAIEGILQVTDDFFVAVRLDDDRHVRVTPATGEAAGRPR